MTYIFPLLFKEKFNKNSLKPGIHLLFALLSTFVAGDAAVTPVITLKHCFQHPE